MLVDKKNHSSKNPAFKNLSLKTNFKNCIN